VSHLAIDENFEPKITGVHLNIPALLHHDVVPDEYKPHFKSFEENADAKTLSQKDMLFFLSKSETPHIFRYLETDNLDRMV